MCDTGRYVLCPVYRSVQRTPQTDTKTGGRGVFLGAGYQLFTPAPYFLGCPPTSGCRRFRRAFPVAGTGATTPVAVTAFGLEAVRFVCVHDMSCVPACYVVGPESPHLVEGESAVWAPVGGVCVCRPPDERCRLLVVRSVVVCLVGVPHYSNFLSSDVVSAIGPGYPVRYDKH